MPSVLFVSSATPLWTSSDPPGPAVNGFGAKANAYANELIAVLSISFTGAVHLGAVDATTPDIKPFFVLSHQR